MFPPSNWLAASFRSSFLCFYRHF
uniref:Uncharacterized protein n=1 Tax=Anguilla anguilla TaxID=7936 RepID=A0A0E9V3T8_ANGAN